jgi:hypothetical protein
MAVVTTRRPPKGAACVERSVLYTALVELERATRRQLALARIIHESPRRGAEGLPERLAGMAGSEVKTEDGGQLSESGADLDKAES